jgi:uncharacterized protein
VPLEITETAWGSLLGVRVSPGSRRTKILGEYGDRLKVEISAPPENDRANEAVCRLLAEVLGVPRDYVSLRSGHKSRDKSMLVRGLAAEEIRARLEQASGPRGG